MRFRSRVAATVVALTTLTLGMTFLAVAAAFNALQYRQLEAAILDVAQREAELASSGSMAFSDLPGPEANAVGPFPKYGIIYDAAGRTVALTDAFGGDPPPLRNLDHQDGQFFDTAVRGVPLRAVLVPIPGHAYRLLLAAPTNDIDDDARFLFRAMAVAFVLAAGWAVLITSAVVSRLTRDHDEIARVARAVARGDMTARVGTRSFDPEVAQLGGDIDLMIDRLALLLASQQRFIAHAAHELRSPVTALQVELQHARRTAQDVATYAAAVDAALDDTRRLGGLATDLLSLARASSHQTAPVEPVPIEHVLAEAVSSVLPLARAKGVELRTESETAVVRARPMDLVRMIRNLLENAVRHSPDGAVVKVSASRAGDFVEVEVCDRGEGITPEDRERIFEPFFRGSIERSDGEGAGLGLSIAREIAREHGGDLQLRADNPGARFVVRIPLASNARDGDSSMKVAG